MYRTAESSLLFAAADGTVTAYARRTGKVVWQFRVPEGEGDFRHFTRLCADERRVVIVAARMNESGFFANADGTPNEDLPGPGGMNVTIESIGDGRTRMTIENIFPDAATMEQLLAMGQEEGMTQAVGQIDAILAEDQVAGAAR